MYEQRPSPLFGGSVVRVRAYLLGAVLCSAVLPLPAQTPPPAPTSTVPDETPVEPETPTTRGPISLTEPQAGTATRPPADLSSMGRGDILETGALSEVAPDYSGVMPASGTAVPTWSPRQVRTSPLTAQITYRISHATGLPNGPGERYESTLHQITPSIAWDIGRHWRVAYAPSWVSYSNDALEDTVNHALLVGWRTDYQGWRLAADHRTAINNSVSIETTDQTERRQHLTSFSASREVTSQLSWEHRLRHNLRSSDRYADFQEYSIEESLTQQFGTRLSASLGVLYGYVQMSEGANHQHLSPRVRARWEVSEKVFLSGWAGVEHRWFSEQFGSTTNPIVDLSLGWAPTETTVVNIGYTRSLSPSFFNNTVTRREVLDASLSQRFLGRYYLTVTASRRTGRYNSIAGSPVDGRRDRYVQFGVSLRTHLGQNGALSLYYRPEADNDSNRRIYSYSVRTYGAEISYRF